MSSPNLLSQQILRVLRYFILGWVVKQIKATEKVANLSFTKYT
jgi:hypothetical protein